MHDWVRKLDRPSWLAAADQWPRQHHRRGLPVRGYPLNQQRVIALVGEGPGKDESAYGYPFIGASGQEVDRHLKRVGLSREMCLTTNVTWQVPGEKGTLGSPNPHLHRELMDADPHVIMTLGRPATQHFLGDVDMEAVHGIPHMWTAPWNDGEHGEYVARYIVLPAYHPAAGMHQVELSAHVAYDFDMLAAVLAGTLPVRDAGEAQPESTYVDLTDDDTLTPAQPDWWSMIAIDTEGSVARPWGLSACVVPGYATVLRKGVADKQIAAFGRALQWCAANVPGFIVYLHNSMHDLPVLVALGIDLVGWGVPFIDTMVLAYHLCIEPQGLKPLARRHCNMTMNSYSELVGPYTHQRAVEYLVRVAGDTTLPRRDGYVDFEIKDRVKTPKYHQPTHIAKRAAKILDDLAKDKRNKDGEPVDPYKRWYKIEPEDRAIAEAVHGVLHEGSIFDVPLSEAVPYSGCDAVATRRIGPILRARHQAVFGRAA